jgi:uncharacterized Tic20 family protein
MQAPIATEERNWAMAAHLGALVAVAGLPFGHVLGPLIVYLIKGHESAFVGEHARASLNYQITISVLGIVAILVGVGFSLAFIAGSEPSPDAKYGIAFVTLWVALGAAALVILLLSIIFIIMGSIAASQGRPYTYPLAIRFLR